MHLTRTASSCSGVIAIGFSCEYPCIPTSWPASTTIFVSSGNVSIECPGMNQVVFMSYLSNIFSRRLVPTSPAKMPREMSSGESSPPYDPSQPATASTSTPITQKISFAIALLP